MNKVIILCIAVFAMCSSAFATLTSFQTFSGAPMSFALHGGKNKLFFTQNSVTDNLWVYSIDPATGLPVGTAVKFTVTDTNGLRGMAINPVANKLYMIKYNYPDSNIFVVDLSDTGMPVGAVRRYTSGMPADYTQGIYLNFLNKRLYTQSAGNAGTCWGNNVLNDSGEPTGETRAVKIYLSGGAAFTGLDVDMDRSVAYTYVGSAGGGPCYTTISSNGDIVAGYNFLGYTGTDGNVTGLMTDSSRNRMYVANTGCYVIKLNAGSGSFDTFVAIAPIGFYPVAPCVDPGRNLIVLGSSASGRVFYAPLNPITYYPDTTAYDTFSVSATVNCIMINPYVNKVYIGTTSGLDVYSFTNQPLTAFTINNGAGITNNQTVTLNIQASNNKWIYVKGDDLSGIGSPVNALDTWVSMGTKWTNDNGATRLTTLDVTATLKPGFTKKTVSIYMIEGSAGYAHTAPTSVAYMCTASIQFVSSSATVDSVTLSPVQYSGIKVNYRVADGYARTSNVSIEYSVDLGNTYVPATQMDTGEGLTGLATSLAGAMHEFYWDFDKDVVNPKDSVLVRIKAHNGDTYGEWWQSAIYTVPLWDPNLTVTNSSKLLATGQWQYSASVWWNASTDTIAIYEIQRKEVNPMTGVASGWQYVFSTDQNNASFLNLSDTAIYYFRVRARASTGISTNFTESAPIILSRLLSTRASMTTDGGTMEIEDYDGNAENNPKLVIEQGTLSKNHSVTFVRYEDEVYDVRFYNEKNAEVYYVDLKKPVMILLPYNRDAVKRKGWDESKLSIYYYDEVKWNQIGSAVDKAKAVVSCKVSHFTKFRIMEAIAISSASVNPQFFTPNSDGINDRARFDLTSNALVDAENRITITDISGKIVREIRMNDASSVEWDGFDNNGNLCESGTYLYFVKTKTKSFTGSVYIVK